MQDRSAIKRDRILKTATALFIEHGCEHTTFAMVAKASGAAIGSITHFFGDKSGLAAAVLEDVARPLVANAEAALHAHPKDVQAAIHALLSACLDWAAGHPEYPRLIAQLEANLWKREARLSQLGRHGVTAALAKWAEPLLARQRIAPLSPAQLYAIVMAPILDTFASVPGQIADENALQWLQTLTEAATAALAGPVRRSKPGQPDRRRMEVEKPAPALKDAAGRQGSFLLPAKEP